MKLFCLFHIAIIYFVEIVFELITIYNAFSMLIELINCNKINVSLHFACLIVTFTIAKQ